MDSVWFAFDENDVESSNSSSDTYLGVFNQDPSEIHSWLQRPKAPFNVSASLPTPHFTSADENSLYDAPEMRQPFGFTSSFQENGCDVPFVSVF
ncbi:hypothetical protein TVAGG3_0516550 [Trichomonas vaginalis G3]|uniref:hypothetical protein n=1 Tax=Trichomonas vaginalis (strain ATCC PRA-98 / G3) TaxID=412133 RepID=UPI0021E5B9B3|nr:hypothetical protein TVAGG3_0516550 [Trichomonas vaginalis G3]KAI5518174.1 hypothetical protein TVAGG3_0516550 [Trichomonas vaginalis G3]